MEEIIIERIMLVVCGFVLGWYVKNFFKELPWWESSQ